MNEWVILLIGVAILAGAVTVFFAMWPQPLVLPGARHQLIWGTYRVPRADRRGLLGHRVYVGPILSVPHVYVEGLSYWDAWRRASGAEVTILGRSFYVAVD